MDRGDEPISDPAGPPPVPPAGLTAFGGFRAANGWPPAPDLVAISAVDSTNSLARRLLARLEEEDEPARDFLVIALEQTAGRGRSGRRWESPPGAGVYATRVLRLPPGTEAGELPLRVPLALCEALGELLGERCRIKWPNDLLVSGRKIGGVLIEVLRAGGEDVALIGFGLNHRLAGEVCHLPAATALGDETCDALSLPAFAVCLVAALERELGRLGPEPELVGRFRRRLVHEAGDELRVRCGEEVLHGRFTGLDDRGYLLLATVGGERRIAAGEVLE